MKGWTRLTNEPIEARQKSALVRDTLDLFADAFTSGSQKADDSVDIDDLVLAAQARAGRVNDAESRAWGIAFAGVIGNLVQQGWALQFQKKHLWGQRPLGGMTRDALRQRMLVRRDEQLSKSSVREFVRDMERWRLFRGERTSIVCLMRDGRSLATEVEKGKTLSELVDPYVQFVVSDEICQFTGLRTLDIWRYFRHTWTSPYESVPGRSLLFIVRDRAAKFHPVIGIGALSSAAVRLGPRDRFIGWDTDQVIDRIISDALACRVWALRVLQNAVDEIYKVDFIRDKLLPADPNKWTLETATAIAGAGAVAKVQHHRMMEANAYKAEDDVSTEEQCVVRAEMPLFRAKRAAELARLIPMLIQLRAGLPEGGDGRELLSKVVRIARSKTVGTEIADLTVCGAVAPYSHFAGGKLVAMLAASPAVVAEYKRRYENSPGIIASSMAGRPIGRPANLCFIGTTSLYGRRPNQYDRLCVPANVVGGHTGDAIRYEYIRDESDSRTQGIGTFHFSSATLKGLERFVSSRRGGWRANNLFGEGTSPKLRGLRDGLVALDLNSDELLVHGIERCMYGVKLARNVADYLLGVDQEPDWKFECDGDVTDSIAKWWLDRWGQPRSLRPDVVAAVRRESLAHPIRHGARVKLPDHDSKQFDIL